MTRNRVEEPQDKITKTQKLQCYKNAEFIHFTWKNQSVCEGVLNNGRKNIVGENLSDIFGPNHKQDQTGSCMKVQF
jgi:hypothetical protein